MKLVLDLLHKGFKYAHTSDHFLNIRNSQRLENWHNDKYHDINQMVN